MTLFILITSSYGKNYLLIIIFRQFYFFDYQEINLLKKGANGIVRSSK
jgi:hypothetical protein